MDINRGNMNTLFTGFNMNFQSGLEQSRVNYAQFCTIIKSQTAMNSYPYLERFGGMSEWLGDRQVKNLSSKTMEVINRDFEDTVAVKRNDLEDDSYGIYSTLFQDLGLNAQEIWGELAIDALLGGETVKWVDGKTFFAGNHKYGRANINNKGTDALSVESYKAARLAMYQYKGHNGKPMKVRPSLLVVGPKNEEMAFNVLKNELILNTKTVTVGENDSAIGGAVKNAWAGSSDYIVLPELGAQWFLMDISHALKPVVVQRRKEAQLIRLDKENDENTFMRNEFLYGTSARGAAALTFPHLVFGSFPA